MREEENASGISAEPTKLDLAVEEITTMEEISETDRIARIHRQKAKARGYGQANGGGDKKSKRKRRSGNDTIEYLKDKAGKDFELKKEELSFKKEQQNIENKRHKDSLVQQQRMMELLVQQKQQIGTKFSSHVPTTTATTSTNIRGID